MEFPVPAVERLLLSHPRRSSEMVARGLACVAAILSASLLLPVDTRTGFLLPASGAFVLGALLFLHAWSLRQSRGRYVRNRLSLENRDQDLRSLIEESFDAIVILDDEFICREANPALAQLLGVKQHSLIGRTIDQFLFDSAETTKLRSQIRDSRSPRGRIELIRADGARIHAEFSSRTSCHSGWHLLLLRDATELARAEEMKSRSLATARSSSVESQILRNATLALTRRDPLNVMLDRLFQTLHSAIPCEAGCILLFEAPGKLIPVREMSWTESGNRKPRLDSLIDSDSFPVFQQILRERRGMVIADTQHAECAHNLPEHLAAGSWFGVPLFAGDETLGILSLTHSVVGYWTQEHLRLATMFAIPVSLAIYQARLYEQKEIYRSELEAGLPRFRPSAN
jgi:PAS domain S-box-containing protein